MDSFLTKTTNLFHKFYKPKESKIELAFVSGGALIDCVDKASDFDIVFVTNTINAEKELWVEIDGITVSFLGNINNQWNLYTRLFAYFIEDKHILFATPNGLIQLAYYKSQAMQAVREFWTTNLSWVNDFLNKDLFRKELYHFVYCWEILTEGKEKVDRQLLLDMKRGRANDELRQWLAKIKNYFTAIHLNI